MHKYLFLVSLFLLFNNCSVDTKSGLWENKNEPKLNKKIADLNFTNEQSYEDFKQNAIEYGKISSFPKLD